MASKVSQLNDGLIARKGKAAPTAPKPIESDKTKPRGIAGTIAVTVRLDPKRYEDLKLHGVRHRRTNQDILTAALDAYLA